MTHNLEYGRAGNDLKQTRAQFSNLKTGSGRSRCLELTLGRQESTSTANAEFGNGKQVHGSLMGLSK